MKKSNWIRSIFFASVLLLFSPLLLAWTDYRYGSDRSGFAGGDKTKYTQLQKMWENSSFGSETVFSSLVILGDYIYVGSNAGVLYKIFIKNGTVSGTYNTNGESISSPLAYNGKIYFTDSAGYVHGVNENLTSISGFPRKTSGGVINSGFAFVTNGSSHYLCVPDSGGVINVINADC
jgi:hypothetical protein